MLQSALQRPTLAEDPREPRHGTYQLILVNVLVISLTLCQVFDQELNDLNTAAGAAQDEHLPLAHRLRGGGGPGLQPPLRRRHRPLFPLLQGARQPGNEQHHKTMATRQLILAAERSPD